MRRAIYVILILAALWPILAFRAARDKGSYTPLVRRILLAPIPGRVKWGWNMHPPQFFRTEPIPRKGTR